MEKWPTISMLTYKSRKQTGIKYSSTRSSSVPTLSRPPTISSSKVTDRSFILCITPSLESINSLIQSVSLASHVSTHLIYLSAHLYYHLHSHYPSLLHSFTPGSKPTFSTNPSHLRFLLPTGLPS